MFSQLATAFMLLSFTFGLKCGNDLPSMRLSDQQIETYNQIDKAAAARTSQLTQANVPVRVFYHVVGSTLTEAQTITTAILRNQTAVLNTQYSSSQFRFTFMNASYTGNPEWATVDGILTGIGNAEYEMKDALRVGNYRDLNIYILSNLTPTSGLNGQCTFPTYLVSPPSWNPTIELMLDGCIIDFGTLPGAANAITNLGKVAVHEVGHWLGLRHVWGDILGCTGEDNVDDTPVQYGPTSMSEIQPCPGTSTNTCPQPGNDNVKNHMDYTLDRCRTLFTSGQRARMNSLWTALRQNAPL